MITLRPVEVFHGPSPISRDPVVAVEWRAPSWAGPRVLRAAQALQARSANWCDAAQPPADLAPLLQGVWRLADWALQALNLRRGFLHARGCSAGDDDTSALLWVGFHDEELSRAAITLGARWMVVLDTLSGAPIATNEATAATSHDAALAQEFEQLQRDCRDRHPDYQARILMTAARARGIPVLPFLQGTRFWQYGWGARSRVFLESASNADGMLGAQWAGQKHVGKELLRALGLPTPPFRLIQADSDVAPALQAIGYPCVVKPLDGGGGRGVTAGITGESPLRAAVAHARHYTQGPLMLECHVQGQDYRLFMVAGRLAAAIRREPSFVVGDGQGSVAELVAALNGSRSPHLVKSRYLRTIATDGVLVRQLAAQGLQLADVPAAGQRVTLRSNANLSTGGVTSDVTPSVHPQVRAMAEHLAATLGLHTTGLDYLSTDITQSPADSDGVFIEMNAYPGLDVCAAAGWPEEQLAQIVLGPEVGPIPVELEVVSDDSLEARRQHWLAAPLAEGNGVVCGHWARIGSITLQPVAGYPWSAVQAALRHRILRRLRLVCSAQALLAHGVPVAQAVAITVEPDVLPPPWLDALKACLTHNRIQLE